MTASTETKETRAFFVTGTGTGVGKTVATASIAAAMLSKGLKVGVVKPIETGVAAPADAIASAPAQPTDLDFVEAFCRRLGLEPVIRRGPYSFPDAVSPHLAARLAGQRVEIGGIVGFIDKLKSDSRLDILIIEGAGGVCVPLDDAGTMMLDLMAALKASAILAAPVTLGTINHCLLSLEALRRDNIPISGVVFNRVPENPGVMERDNMEIVGRLGKVDILAKLPDSPPSPEAKEAALRLVSRALPCAERLLKTGDRRFAIPEA